MNKKYILCIFVVLIIIASSACSKPMSKRAKMVPMSKTFDVPPEERTSNTTEGFIDVIDNLNAVGFLNVVKTDGSEVNCTATVIRTNTGNIAITAAHCLWDHTLKTFNSEIYFFPGYNNGRQGRVGKVTGYKWFVWSNFKQDFEQYDYGFIKFYYQDGKKLQDDTGAFDYDLVIPQGTHQTTVFGYVNGSSNMGCTRDGQNICEWQGNSFDFPNNHINYQWYRGISIDVGYGASGGPWIRNYDPYANANTASVMGVSHGILFEPNPEHETVSWVWEPDEFTRLLNLAESSN